MYMNFLTVSNTLILSPNTVDYFIIMLIPDAIFLWTLNTKEAFLIINDSMFEHNHSQVRFPTLSILVLCQDLLQIKWKIYPHINSLKHSICLRFLHTVSSFGNMKLQWLWIHFVFKKLPDIRTPTDTSTDNYNF